MFPPRECLWRGLVEDRNESIVSIIDWIIRTRAIAGMLAKDRLHRIHQLFWKLFIGLWCSIRSSIRRIIISGTLGEKGCEEFPDSLQRVRKTCHHKRNLSLTLDVDKWQGAFTLT